MSEQPKPLTKQQQRRFALLRQHLMQAQATLEMFGQTGEFGVSKRRSRLLAKDIERYVAQEMDDEHLV